MTSAIAMVIIAGTISATNICTANAIEKVRLQPAIDFENGHYVIFMDRGGDVDMYAEYFALLEQSGNPVWVTSYCISSCTMVLRNPKACATPNALFGFHAARKYDKKTLAILGESDVGTQLMWMHYPERVRARLGGRLGAELIYIQGTQLLPACEPGKANNEPMKPKPVRTIKTPPLISVAP
jgi:hypothetical protein